MTHCREGTSVFNEERMARIKRMAILEQNNMRLRYELEQHIREKERWNTQRHISMLQCRWTRKLKSPLVILEIVSSDNGRLKSISTYDGRCNIKTNNDELKDILLYAAQRMKLIMDFGEYYVLMLRELLNKDISDKIIYNILAPERYYL